MEFLGQGESSNFGLDNSANDLGLTLSPGSMQELVESGLVPDTSDLGFDMNAFDLAFSSLDNPDWGFDELQAEKKRNGDEAFPDESNLSTSKKQHVESQHVQTSAALNIENHNMSLLCEPMCLDGAVPDTGDITSVASATSPSPVSSQNNPPVISFEKPQNRAIAPAPVTSQIIPSVITFERGPQNGAVRANMSFGVETGNRASRSSHGGPIRKPATPSKQTAKMNMSVNTGAGNKASISPHMAPIRVSPTASKQAPNTNGNKTSVSSNMGSIRVSPTASKQTPNTNGVGAGDKASVSSHGPIRMQPTRASSVAKQKFQVKQQDVAANAAGETVMRVNPRPEPTLGNVKTGYVPSTPNQHARVVQVPNDMMKTYLLGAQRQIAALTAERNKFKEFYEAYAAVDPANGIPKYKVLEKERATLRRLCTTQKGQYARVKGECKEWETKYFGLAGQFNSLLYDYHRLLQAFTENAANGIQVPLPTTAYPVAVVPHATNSAESAQPHESSPASLPSLTSGSSATGSSTGSPAHVQQLVPVPNTAIAASVQNANRINPVTSPAQPQSAMVIDLTDKSPVSNPAIEGSQSGPETSQTVTTVNNALVDFHRAVRQKEFGWLHQHDADAKIAMNISKASKTKKNRSKKDSTKDGGAPDSDGHHKISIKEAYDFVKSQKAIRSGLGWPFRSTSADEGSSEEHSGEHNSNHVANVTDTSDDLDSLFGSPGPADFAGAADPIVEDAPAVTTTLPEVGPDGGYHVTDLQLCAMLEAELMRDD